MLAIVRAPIDVGELQAAVVDLSHGGVVTFAGVVRSRGDDGRVVTGLGYEAYEPLALAEFAAVASEARARFGDVRVAIVHRVGELRPGETAVAVVAASAHRRQAFEACAYAIDAVKSRAAIWKRERYADGASAWLANARTAEPNPS